MAAQPRWSCPVLTSLLALGGLLLATPAVAQGNNVALRDAVEQAGGRVIITLKSSTTPVGAMVAPGTPPVTPAEMDQISSRLRGSYEVAVRERAPFVGMLMAEVDPAQVAALANDPNVARVEADRLWELADAHEVVADRWAAYRKSPGADTEPWGVGQVTAPQVWAMGNKGDGVKVAVMDTGGDPTHPDLNYAGGYNAIFLADPNAWTDDLSICNGHGTHIAGTIAGKDDGNGVVGIAPHAQLYAIKVFENISGSCLAYTSSQITGLNWAVSQGIRLVNVSIGGGYSPSYDAAIQSAAAKGTYVFAAAGNNGAGLTYPGSAAYAFGIGATDGGNNRAGWSDFGPQLDFVAPGVGIYSTMPVSLGSYGTKSGTSMATPHALGVAALILSAYPSLSFDQLRQKLIDGALDLETTGLDDNTGYGLVRAYNSLAGTTPPPVPLVLAVSPSSRYHSVVAGSAAPSDSATVTLTGDGSSGATWTAAKRKSWTTLTTSSGTGSGRVRWSRTASGLAAGTYVDTVTVTASGATGSPTTVIDTLVVTPAPVVVPLSIVMAPGSRSATITSGDPAPGDSVSVVIHGDGAAEAGWNAVATRGWISFVSAAGTGSGTLRWLRSASGLAAGTYVDTIRVSLNGAAASAQLIDTMVIAAPAPKVSTWPHGRRRRFLIGQLGSWRRTEVTTDSVQVQGTSDSTGLNGWTATALTSGLQLQVARGQLGGYLYWIRDPESLPTGLHVDTIQVRLERDSMVTAFYVDTIEVVPVAEPEAPAAIEDLFHAGSITADQRVMFDREGNNNGRYDIGDFLAWVDRTGIRLGASVMGRVQSLVIQDAERSRAREAKKDQ